MAEKAKKKKKDPIAAPLPSARARPKSVTYRPTEETDNGSLLSSSAPSSWPPPAPPPPEPEAPPPLQTAPAHITPEQMAEHDRIVKESQDIAAERERGWLGSVLDPVIIDPSKIGAKGSLWGYYGGATPPAPFGEGPTFEETLEPLKIFDVLGRGVRKLVTGLPETQLAAPGEESRLIGNIVTDMLTDPLLVAGFAKAGISGLRGIRSLLDDVVSAGLAGQDPGVAQMYSRVRPEQLDELATGLQEGLLEGGFKRLPANYQRALTRALAPGGAIADQRGALHPAYEGMFTKSPSNMYSQMGRALERKLPGKASPKEMRELVQKFGQKGDYKPAELEWSGLEQWLTAKHNTYPKTKLTKEDVLDYVRANELDVQVTTRRGDAASSQYSSYVEGDPDNWTDYQEVLVRLPSREARFSQHFSEEDTIAWFRTVERRFKDPVTGEERRILFVEELQSDWHQKGRKYGYAEEGAERARGGEYDEARELFEEAEENYEVLQNDYGMTADDAYYELEAAKERYNDLEYEVEQLQGQWNDLDSEADDIVNELQEQADAALTDKQMDLPGTPEREPIDVEVPEEMQDELNDLQNQIDEAEGNMRAQEDIQSDAESAHDSLQEAENDLNETRREMEGLEEGGDDDALPPPAPFGRTWPELGFKRMLQKAVDDGYDTVAWSRGQVQADRYNAAKHIEDLEWTRRTGFNKAGGEEDQYVLRFRTKEDVEAGRLNTWNEKVAPADKLDDWVGPQIAKKIQTADTGLLENEELWLGGEKLIFFYDGEMRRTAQKLVKKYGGKVTTESMGPTFKVVEIPASSGEFTSWADTEIPRLRLQRNALLAQEKKLTDLSPPSSYRPNLHHQVTVLQRRGADLSNRRSMLVAAKTRIEHGTSLDKIDPTVLEAFAKANPNLEVKYGLRDPSNRTRTGKMIFDTREEAEKAASPMVNTIRIPEKMREAIKERGFPLYQILLGTTGAAGGAKATAEAMSAHKEQ